MRSGPVAIFSAMSCRRQRKVAGGCGVSGAVTGSGCHINSGRGVEGLGQSFAGSDHAARRGRQQQYELEARSGEAEQVEWFKAGSALNIIRQKAAG